MSARPGTVIQVLGLGCGRCHAVHQIARAPVARLELDAPVEKVEDVAEIVHLGVMSTPALVLDGRVGVAGSVASVEQVRWLGAAAGG